MTMKSFFRPLLVATAALALAAGCNKPSKDECRKAIENMRVLMGTEMLNTDVEGEVRRCNGGSSKAAVDCATKATSLDQLRDCKFMHVPGKSGAAPAAPGSAAPAAPAGGSAAPTGSGSGSGAAS